MKKIIVLGALSAIAEATCRPLATQGAHLALFGRNESRLRAVADDVAARGGRADIFVRDLADAGDADAALADAARVLGGADVVVLFYGVLGEQAKAEADPVHARAIIDVNFTSAALWMLAGARLLEAQPAGAERPALVAVSSVAGDRGRRSNFVYGAAKGGLSILMQGLAHRSANAGIRAVAVKLGFVDTPMTAGIKKGGPLWATPAQAGAAIVKAMESGGAIVYAPWFWRWIMLAVRATPEVVFNKVNL
ncbi:MAG: SDR family NAD(P)-dependent oxidoreductase [Hyphomonadaceae bacterium]|nr:SDR family NAD(P)-dependent oxidoreductase [Hyphomonadaceae bacterium]